MSEDRDFEAQLRAGLHAAAAEVDPDPAGWRQLNARIRRRRTTIRGGALALAGTAAALVAITVLPGDDGGVDFAPADPDAIATQQIPMEPPTAPVPGDADAPTVTPADPVAGGIVYSDGSAIHVTDTGGEVLFTPWEGDESAAVTDVAARPGGTTTAFTMAVRVRDAAVGVDGCGELFWNHVTQTEGRVTGDSLPESGLAPGATEGCLGAPVFASDGSALAWVAETPAGEVQLQTLGWTEEGPVEGSLTTFGLDTALEGAGLTDPVLVDWTLEPAADGSTGVEAVGALVLRASRAEGASGPEGLSTFLLPAERQADGALALPPAEPAISELVDELGIGGTIIDTHRRWRLVRLPTAGAEERVGLATPPGEGDGDGEPTPPLTAETELLLDTDARPFLDALGTTAVFGVGQALFVAEVVPGNEGNPGSVTIDGDLPTATTAALLLTPGAAPAAAPDDPSPTSSATAGPEGGSNAAEGSDVAGSEPTAVPTPPLPGSTGDVAGLVYVADDDGIVVGDLDGGAVYGIGGGAPVPDQPALSTTDVAVRPGGTTADFSLAYRLAADDDCGLIDWVGGSIVQPRPPPSELAGPLSGDVCAGAPVFASDGLGLAWLTEDGEGSVAVQTLDWTADGPVPGSLLTHPLDRGSLSDLILVDWSMRPGRPEGIDETGELAIRATDGDGRVGLFQVLMQHSDGVIELLTDDVAEGGPVRFESELWAPDALRLLDRADGIGVGVVEPATGGPLTYGFVGAGDGTEFGGFSSDGQLTWSPGDPLVLDVVGDSVLLGTPSKLHLQHRTPTGVSVTELPFTTRSAALLGAPPP